MEVALVDERRASSLVLQEIHSTVAEYLARYPGERGRLDSLLSSLALGRNVASRSTLEGHVTCGALLLDANGRSLQVRHKTLDRWLYPGGHVEPHDPSLMAAALRELQEETGISADTVAAVGDGLPLDIDLHRIPANAGKGEHEHWHADFLYLFRGSTEAVVALDPNEVTEFAWLERPGSSGLQAKLESVRRDQPAGGGSWMAGP
jgi:8-oxo-dGTP pyrophosphatase MutT (NUDIX family)